MRYGMALTALGLISVSVVVIPGESRAASAAPALIEAAVEKAADAIGFFQTGMTITIVNNTDVPVRFLDEYLVIHEGEIALPITNNYILPGTAASMAVKGTVTDLGTVSLRGRLFDTSSIEFSARSYAGEIAGTNSCSVNHEFATLDMPYVVSCTIGHDRKADLRIYISPS